MVGEMKAHGFFVKWLNEIEQFFDRRSFSYANLLVVILKIEKTI
jgi:hypothetical protein